MFKIGDKVRLLTFNNKSTPPKRCRPEENYWLLIGEAGSIAEEETAFDRVLVKFDISVVSKGLYCHNEIPNTLYILKTDLEII